MTPGTLVSYREREWVVLPSDDPDMILLRPLGGSSREVCGVARDLAAKMAYSLPYERITEAKFPKPPPTEAQDHAAVELLLDASRLLVRDGAAPFRSLGHLSVRPRPYQFVPMLMALRLDNVRLLIADDVGVGKTIEAGLVARELLDRGEIQRVAVLCPPYLCDQWRKELAEKFHIEAEVVRSGTVARLERTTPPDTSIFEHYPHIVASIDTVKSQKYRHSFLQHCPELLIVDEAHGAARPPSDSRSHSQKQRYELVRDLAEDESRHVILLTATPHSGVEESFLSLLELLRPEFGSLQMEALSEADRDELVRYFVQRRRADVKQWMGEETPFPDRDPQEVTYQFTPEYRKFYGEVYDFARGLIQSADSLGGWQQRMRYWSALALMRCVTSSPAAAKVTLLKRVLDDDEFTTEELQETTIEELDDRFEPMVFDRTEAESALDAPPTAVFDAQEKDPRWTASDQRRLREFAKTAHDLQGDGDAKLQAVIQVVGEALKDGYRPIVWCRYIATSDYVAEQLQEELEGDFKHFRATSINGLTPETERRLKVDELAEYEHRVLVATDCLSEGINLQEHFDAVVHYDLPWNPNRLEQREGRVDRFGQISETVRTVLLYGEDNPVDGSVLDVLLRKARDIYKSLGIHVPVPVDSESVMETVLKSVFSRSYNEVGQLGLFDATEMAKSAVSTFHYQMDLAAEREKTIRSRFAQRRIKPEEVQRELEETDAILGDPADVREFLRDASQRLGFGFRQLKDGTWEVDVAALPPSVRHALGDRVEQMHITFETPVPEDVTYVGRSHRLVESLAEHLMDAAFYPGDSQPPAARTGAIRTDAVDRVTTLLLLRLRFLVTEEDRESPTLAEETIIWGYRGLMPDIEPIPPDEARRLLDAAQPSANISAPEKREYLTEAIDAWDDPQPQLEQLVNERANRIMESHRRIRSLVKAQKTEIEPKMPPDLLGVLVLVPVPQGVRA